MSAEADEFNIDSYREQSPTRKSSEVYETYLQSNQSLVGGKEVYPGSIDAMRFAPTTRMVIVIPAYKEAEVIENTIASIHQNIGLPSEEYAVIVVDNGSAQDESEERDVLGTTTFEATRNAINKMGSGQQAFCLNGEELGGVYGARDAGIELAARAALSSLSEEALKDLVVAQLDAERQITEGWGKVIMDGMKGAQVGAVYGEIEFETAGGAFARLDEEERQLAETIARRYYERAVAITALDTRDSQKVQGDFHEGQSTEPIIYPSGNIAFRLEVFLRNGQTLQELKAEHSVAEANLIVQAIETEGLEVKKLDSARVIDPDRLSERTGGESMGAYKAWALRAVQGEDGEQVLTQLDQDIAVIREKGINPIEEREWEETLRGLLHSMFSPDEIISGHQLYVEVRKVIDVTNMSERARRALQVVQDNSPLRGDTQFWVNLLLTKLRG